MSEEICSTCNGFGMVGGWRIGSGYESDACPDCRPPTPRVDNAESDDFAGGTACVHADFARQLEVELNCQIKHYESVREELGLCMKLLMDRVDDLKQAEKLLCDAQEFLNDMQRECDMGMKLIAPTRVLFRRSHVLRQSIDLLIDPPKSS